MEDLGQDDRFKVTPVHRKCSCNLLVKYLFLNKVQVAVQ